jgi:Mn-dependent DtxR family transcriptional regulator
MARRPSVPNTNKRRSVRQGPRSESTEDHLERIQELVDRLGYARVSDVAEALGRNRSTVSNMVRRLAKRGYVNYQRYRGFSLTDEGRRVAGAVRDRHRTLTALLQQMGIEAETLEAEVEDIEHHLKPQTLAAMSALVAFWEENPDALSQFREFQRGRKNPKSRV